MFSETKIRCFLTLAETRSFTDAARLLYMTQQGVSKHIADIEYTLGVPLFVRSHHNVELTEEGKRFYEIFSEFLNEYEALLQEIRKGQIQQAKSLRVGFQNWIDFGSAPSVALETLRTDVPCLKFVGERHPPSVLYRRLQDSELDIILISGRFCPKDAGFQSMELIRSPLMLLVSKHNPNNTPKATYQSFSKELFLVDVLEYETADAAVQRARRELHSCGLSPDKIQAMPNRDSVYTAVELGQGVTIGHSMTQVLGNDGIQSYPTKSTEKLLSVWRSGEKEYISKQYAQLLQQEYRKISKSPD